MRWVEYNKNMKRTFKKYQSLINHYHQKDIDWWLNKHPELRDCSYLVNEKLDGSNFSIHFYPDGEVRCSKRSGFIGEGDTFFGYRDAFMHDDVQAFVSEMSGMSGASGHEYVVHGELFGPGIQKRVDYGSVRRILFYGVDIDGKPTCGQAFLNVVPKHLRVPTVGIVSGFEAALATSNEFPTLLNPVEGNVCEGIVITPLDICPLDANGDAFIVKSKNTKFSESKEQKPRARDSLDDAASELSAIAISHVTESRLLSVVSKLGEPTHVSQFGSYMRALMADIDAEMVHEYREQLSELSSGDRKRCMSAANKDASELIRARFRAAGLM